jgi:hypothetical protein
MSQLTAQVRARYVALDGARSESLCRNRRPKIGVAMSGLGTLFFGFIPVRTPCLFYWLAGGECCLLGCLEASRRDRVRVMALSLAFRTRGQGCVPAGVVRL